MRRMLLAVLAAALALGGCGSGPKPSRHKGSFIGVKKLLSDAEARKEKDDFTGAITSLDEFDKAADKLLTKMPPGDPYRQKALDLVEEAGKLRKDVADKKRRVKEAPVKVAKDAKAVGYKEFWGEEEKKTDAGGLGEDTKVDPALVARKREEMEAKAAEARRRAQVQKDRETRAKEAIRSERIGEVKEDPKKPVKKPKPAFDPTAKPKMPRVKIKEDTEPLQVVKVCKQGPMAVVYLLIINKTDKPFRVGSVTGDFLDSQTNFVDRVSMCYEFKGFKPNWKEIFSSKGTAITAESLVVDAKSAKMIALVSQHKDARRIAKLRVRIPTSDGPFLQGPD